MICNMGDSYGVLGDLKKEKPQWMTELEEKKNFNNNIYSAPYSF